MQNEEIILKLIEKNLTISTAESCTGGLLGKTITSVPGASSIYGYGFITYANEAKENILGVSSSTLKTLGAVSPETACEMAEGARRVSKSDIAVSTTGIAGPGGGTDEKPIGLVYIAISYKDTTNYKKLNLSGDRDSIRAQACREVFKLIEEKICN